MRNRIKNLNTAEKNRGNPKSTIIRIGITLFLLLWNNSCNEGAKTERIKKDNWIEIQKESSFTTTEKLREKWMNEFASNNFGEALKIFFKLESSYLKTKNDNELRNVYRLIWTILLKQRHTTEALIYFDKSLKIAKNCNNQRGIMLLYACIWETHQELWNNNVALPYFLQWRKFANTIPNLNDKEAETKVMLATDIARRYLKIGNNKKLAKQYRDQAIQLNKNTDNIGNTITLLYDMGDYESETWEKEKALEKYKEWIELINKTSGKDLLKEIGYNKIWNRYEENNNRKEALKYKKMGDSLNEKIVSENSTQQINELNILHETEKKEQQITLQQTEIEKQAVQKEKMIWIIVASLIAALGAGSGGISAYRKRKQKEKQNAELEKKNEEITAQKTIIENKNTNIRESIEAGIMVQQEIVLSSPEYIKELFPESFVLFKPKDGVSGDFYRFKETKSGKKLFAAVDCTGHGIPWAFISFSGSKILDWAIEKWFEKPNKILSYLDQEIIKVQNKGVDKDKDVYAKYGMDIALCSRDEKTRTLEYSGAVNPIFIVKQENGKTETTILKANKKKIGYRIQGQENAYKNDSIKITDPNTILYLFSDGYQDQFGWERWKKLKSKEFQNYIEEATQEWKTMEEIQKILEEKFKNRIGDEEQIDDVMVIGIKV